MTPEEINNAMADLEGMTARMRAWYMANYTEDLNAVARVVGKLSVEQKSDYWTHLGFACTGFDNSRIDATAAQRCEAVLRACGKWVEG